MSERTMIIPAPVALPGQAVEVHNYRIKNRVVFERGKCVRAEYTLFDSRFAKFSGRWSFEVVLDRRNPRGQWMRLSVGEGEIRPVAVAESEVGE